MEQSAIAFLVLPASTFSTTMSLKHTGETEMPVIGTLGTAEARYKSHVAGTLEAGAANEEAIGVIAI